MVFNLNKIINLLVLGTVALLLLANLLPEMQTAGTNVSNTGAPLSGLFASQGVLFVVIMAAFLVMFVRAFMGKK